MIFKMDFALTLIISENFNYFKTIQEYLVVTMYEPVCYGKYSPINKSLPDGFLDHKISLYIYSGRSLVQNYYLVVGDKSTR